MIRKTTFLFSLTLVFATAAAAAPCPPASSSTPALDQLKGAAASGDMAAVTGDGCTQTPAEDPSGKTKGTAASDTAKPKPPASVPDLTVKKPASSGDSIWSKIKKPFEGLPINQTLAGAGFGALAGMILFMGTPVGLIGAALIGAFVGAVLFSGIISKLMGHGGSRTGGS